ncbi:nuclear transport factor 2 family protein [Roseomonas sp. KE0001]|uniref:nuclear transport factor 2 family protein n=1 Tax=unclassified Roseomonas TaxID=2617492 RepID=UPI0018DFC50C|nr:nuclear transport factor 2 family protein [Roseomonas sp. KE0001]MBI0433870.1 nuclear transport factor 2 family protein [Roseomonas sp. KE0001]
MMMSRRGVALAAALCLSVGIAAPRAAAAQEARGGEAVVARAVDALTEAMLKVDRARLAALTAEKLSYGHSAGRIENKEQFIAYLESKASAFTRIELSEQTIDLAGPNAIVRHLMVGETVSPAGQTTPVRIGVMQVWQKDGNDWRLLARQAFRL